MKLYGLSIVKNEDDVIGESIRHALTFCDKVVVLDNGSTDKTWQILQDIHERNPDKVILFGRSEQPFRNSMRAEVYNEFNKNLSSEDWWLRLDADEFIAEDPRPFLLKANKEKADFIKAWQIQFYYTDKDHDNFVSGFDHAESPITDRRLYYKINWREYRFFRNQPDISWDASKNPEWPNGLSKTYKKLIFNRHYQYRSPQQIQNRLKSRHENPDFKHIKSLDWKTQIQPSRLFVLHKNNKPWKIDFFDFYKNKILMALKGKTPIY